MIIFKEINIIYLNMDIRLPPDLEYPQLQQQAKSIVILI